MTIATSQNQTTVLGNGVTNTFSFPFVGDAAPYISVTYTPENGISTKVPSSQYTLSLNPPATGEIWGVGGSVTYPISGPPIANSTSLTISRLLPFQQLISISNQGDFSPQVIEEMGDTLEMQIQQVAARTGQIRGIWVTDTQYNFGDIVQDGVNGDSTFNLYMCAKANTSGVWSTDLAAGDWSLALNTLSLITTGTYLPIIGGTILGNLIVDGTTTVQTPVNPTDAATKAYVDANGHLTGEVRAWTALTAPTGWILPYGQLELRADFPTLWAFAQTSGNIAANDGAWTLGQYSPGNGTTTFRVPDLRGNGIAGADNMGGTPANRITVGVSGIAGTLGSAGGDQNMFQHTHGAASTDLGHDHPYSIPIANGAAGGAPNFSCGGLIGQTTGTGTANITTTISNAGSGVSQNVQPTVMLNYILKT